VLSRVGSGRRCLHTRPRRAPVRYAFSRVVPFGHKLKLHGTVASFLDFMVSHCGPMIVKPCHVLLDVQAHHPDDCWRARRIRGMDSRF
jgi:hypothetical protein